MKKTCLLFCVAIAMFTARPLLGGDEDIEQKFKMNIDVDAARGEQYQPRTTFSESAERTLKQDIKINEPDYKASKPRVSLDEYLESMFTNGRANGNYIIGFIKRDKAIRARAYIYAVLDTLIEVKSDVLRKYYPDASFEDVAADVVRYYSNNPSERKRTVADVVLSGCK